MPVSITVKKANAVVEVTKKHAGEVAGVDLPKVEIPVGEVMTDKPTANVGFQTSYTKNLGNYESLKVQVSLNYPVEVDFQKSREDIEEDLSNVFMFVSDWVDKRMKHTLDEIDAAFKK
jgi:hypothetical protein